jgi:hypothetical protein
MPENKPNAIDIFGLAPFGSAIEIAVGRGLDGASALLSRICLPAAEEIGFYLRDKIKDYRERNIINITSKAEALISYHHQDRDVLIHPRLLFKIIEDGSWIEDETVQTMWAGLLSSSCTNDGSDDSNLLFIDILSQITLCQAKILLYACNNCEVSLSEGGWLEIEHDVTIDLAELKSITSVNDSQRLDRELDHLREIGLIGGAFIGGFHLRDHTATITPTSFALHMNARCQGYSGPPEVFYNLIGDINLD